MRKLFSILVLSTIAVTVQAQSMAWLNSYFSGDIIDMDVHPNGKSAICVQGSYAQLLSASDSSLVLETSAQNVTGPWIIIFDVDGNLELAFHYDNSIGSISVFDIEFAEDGSLFIVGSASSTIDLDPGAGTFNLSGGSACFLTKVSATGEFLWAIPVGEYVSAYPQLCMGLDNAGNVCIAGTFTGSFDFDPSSQQVILTAIGEGFNTYISKISTSGNLIWARAIKSGDDVLPKAIACNANGMILLTGAYMAISPGQQPLNLDPGTNTWTFSGNSSAPGDNAYFVVYDEAGSVQVAHAIEDNAIVYPESAQATPDNGFVVTGTFNGTFDADFGSATQTLSILGIAGYNDLFTLKLGEDLSLQWAKMIGATNGTNNSVFNIQVKPNGNLLTVGSIRMATVDIDPGAGQFSIVHTPSFGVTSFIQELDAQGNFVWGEQVTSNATCEVKRIAVVNNETFIVAVNADFQTIFSPHLNYTVPLFNENVPNQFMIGKIGSGTPTFFVEAQENRVQVYPQPSSEVVHLSKLPLEYCRYAVFDIYGKVFLKGTLIGEYETFHVSAIPGGQYVIAFYDAQGNPVGCKPLVIAH